ncbi:MAG: pyridoxamine 5'-phosphate oxidase family protein [Candidatus Omnitrophica bacterium]|nr:pyridoxamine 5'-phosphate oxidase family protein [Candidatus Omnitrophota bacterium]
MTKEEVVDLIRDAGFCLFATTEGDQPRVRPMMPYLTDENQLLLALLKRSRTIAQAKANPLIELCYVDRKMWYCRIAGSATISDDAEKKEILWNNIPMLKQYFGGPQDENFVLMVIDINEVEAMTPHQKEPEKIDFS